MWSRGVRYIPGGYAFSLFTVANEGTEQKRSVASFLRRRFRRRLRRHRRCLGLPDVAQPDCLCRSVR